MANEAELAVKYGGAAPRYTSYPTAPHFGAAVDGDIYGTWLAALEPDEPVSLYLHIPFCDSLCWFCACNTSITRRKAPVARYIDALIGEIDLVAQHVAGSLTVRHLHLGGGSPSRLDPAAFLGLMTALQARFSFDDGADIAIEIDPRNLAGNAGSDRIASYAKTGINRVSLGIQDFAPAVQQAINRIQSWKDTKRVVDALRSAGIRHINFDLMYGLPHQTVASVRQTIAQALALKPSRVALFGYAHVPWMKRHQKLIDADTLPGAVERYREQAAAAEVLVASGYVRIGLDHFALPGDSLADAAHGGRLHRNFQGYTADQAPTLIGLGASAIGSLPGGYVQNQTDARRYAEQIATGHLPSAKGIVLSDDDRCRRSMIEALMCHLEIRPAEFADAASVSRLIEQARGRLARFAGDGLIAFGEDGFQVTEAGRPFVRQIAAQFDRYFSIPAPETARPAYSRAI